MDLSEDLLKKPPSPSPTPWLSSPSPASEAELLHSQSDIAEEATTQSEATEASVSEQVPKSSMRTSTGTKRKKASEEEQCWRSIGQYFATKQTTPPPQTQPATMDDTEVFDRMVAGEVIYH